MPILYTDEEKAAQTAAARKMKRWRERRGITQRDMAVLIGCTHPHVSSMERGRVRPSPRLVKAIEHYCGEPKRATS